MISWIVIMLFFTLQKAIPTRPGGQNIVRYFDPPSRYFHPQWIDDKFFCIPYLFDKIIILKLSMISWIVIMILSWHYQKLSQLDPAVEISYDILTPPWIFSLHSNNQWQSFLCISYLLDKIYHYIEIISMISWIIIMFLFWHYQKLSQLDPGVKISYDILTPSRYFHPPTNQWQSFVCISYLLDKIIMLKWYQWFLE